MYKNVYMVILSMLIIKRDKLGYYLKLWGCYLIDLFLCIINKDFV